MPGNGQSSSSAADAAPAIADFIDAIEAGVLIIDDTLAIRGWNRWMEQVTGRLAEAVMGSPLADIFPAIRPAVIEALREAIGGKPVLMSQSLHRYTIPLPPAAEFESFELMQQTTRLVPTPRGANRFVTVFIHDVTERVARERQLREATDAAERANRAKSDFLAAMSHELRTPIGAMTGYADLILEEIYGPITADQRAHLARIKSVGKHLLEIVEEILLFERIEAGRDEVRLEDLDPWQVARDAVAVIEPIARGKGLDLRVELHTEPVRMRSDSVKVRQILINLLGNAIKFTAVGSVSLTGAITGDGSVVFAVSDSGPGIDPNDLTRIFEPFTQLSNAYTRAQSGTGLGLPVSRRLARLLGGDVAVESELGKGSTFTATLPLTPNV